MIRAAIEACRRRGVGAIALGARTRSLVVALCCAVPLWPQAADNPSTSPGRVYDFQVFLDEKPIGSHRFTVTTDGAERHVTSDARFAVKFLGFEAYRYRHHADEHWNGDCLVALTSSTDDDGKTSRVTLRKPGEVNEIATGAGTLSVPGCLMTYAYWNPALRSRSTLLNPQTGRTDSVTIQRLGTGRLARHGQAILAVDWRISGGEAPIDVWVSEEGDWVGLDSMVAKGRHKLSYRLP